MPPPPSAAAGDLAVPGHPGQPSATCRPTPSPLLPYSSSFLLLPTLPRFPLSVFSMDRERQGICFKPLRHPEIVDAGQIRRPWDPRPRRTSFLCAKSAHHAPFRLDLDRGEQAALLPSSVPLARHLAGERCPRPDPRALPSCPCRRVPPASSSSLHQAAPPCQVPCIAPSCRRSNLPASTTRARLQRKSQRTSVSCVFQIQ